MFPSDETSMIEIWSIASVWSLTSLFVTAASSVGPGVSPRIHKLSGATLNLRSTSFLFILFSMTPFLSALESRPKGFQIQIFIHLKITVQASDMLLVERHAHVARVDSVMVFSGLIIGTSVSSARVDCSRHDKLLYKWSHSWTWSCKVLHKGLDVWKISSAYDLSGSDGKRRNTSERVYLTYANMRKLKRFNVQNRFQSSGLIKKLPVRPQKDPPAFPLLRNLEDQETKGEPPIRILCLWAPLRVGCVIVGSPTWNLLAMEQDVIHKPHHLPWD